MPSILAETSAPLPSPAVPASQIEVLRRDGTKTQLDVTKIRKVVNWACNELDANPIELEAGLTTRLRSGVSTRDIQDNLIDCALGMCSPNEPDWRYVAGRLHVWSLWKDTLVHRGYQYGNYPQTVATKVATNSYDARISVYSDEELKEAGSWINPDWDLDYDYAGAVLLTKRYLLDDELPQEALLTCALLLASPETPKNRLLWARRFYEAIATRKLSLATPILANLRVPGGSLSSCFITSMDDNLESIFETITDTARISKNGGGVGVNVSRIRATGSWVMGKSNASGGMIPWTKLLNDTAIAVNQGGRRAGAVTVSLDVWHMDVPEFLECQTENGDQRRKAYDIFPQLVVTDEFMRRVEHREMWTLVDPYEVRTKLGIELAELWGDKFEVAYAEIESKLDEIIQLYKRVDARELFKDIMKSQVETGMPYLWFKDTANRANPNQHEGYIPGGNLCQESWSNVKAGEEAHTCLVAGTKVLTDQGWKKIEDCDHAKVFVPFTSDEDFTPDGSFEAATLIDNGVRPVYRITLNNGLTIEATDNHKFLTRYGSQQRHRRWAEVNTLQVGDRLEVNIPSSALPGIEPLQAYETQDLAIGWLLGDGWIRPQTTGVCFAPNEDLALATVVPVLEEIHNRVPTKSGGHASKTLKVYVDSRTGVKSVCSGKAGVREWLAENYGLRAAKGPDKRLSERIKSLPASRKASLLSGLFSADGCVEFPSNSRNTPSIRLSSASLGLLNDVRACLVEFGIHSTVEYRYLEERQLSQGSLSINGKFARRFMEYIGFGLTPRKNQRWEQSATVGNKFANNHRRTSKIASIESIGNAQVYDLSIPNGHHFVAEGFVTHNCNLTSLNLANIEASELENICTISVRLLDNTIELTETPFKASTTHNAKYRTIGVGAMGLADWLAKRRLSYKNLEEIDFLFEDIGYHCTKASMELSKERGAYPVFAGSEWSKGHLIGAKPLSWYAANLDPDRLGRWEQLSRDIQAFGIRNSHITAIAPNTSSSLVQGCTASILPTYSRFFYDKWAKGTVPIAPPFIKDFFWFYHENKSIDQRQIVKAVATMQKWIDTGISMELIFNLNAGVYFPDEPERSLQAKDIFDTLLLSWKEGCKAIYYIRTVQRDDFKESAGEGCVSCAN